MMLEFFYRYETKETKKSDVQLEFSTSFESIVLEIHFAQNDQAQIMEVKITLPKYTRPNRQGQYDKVKMMRTNID